MMVAVFQLEHMLIMSLQLKFGHTMDLVTMKC